MTKASLTQKTEKLYLLAHTFDEVINGDVFKYCSYTANGKTIPKCGSRIISVIDARKCAPKRLNCDRVIIHRDGSFTGVYGGLFVKWFKNL